LKKSTSHNPRSTVGTVTEIYDYLRLLTPAPVFRVARARLRPEAKPLAKMVDQVMALEEGSKMMLPAPVIRERKRRPIHLIDQLLLTYFVRARIDGRLYDMDATPDSTRQEVQH
jgi:excinuclease ABC subunit A